MDASLLNNSWVTGIGGGIVSGIVVFFATRWLVSDQSKREYNQKVSSANREVVFAVRQGVPEENLPSAQVLSALLKSTARQYQVAEADLYSPEEVSQDLIKEIMDSNFISAKTKELYCERLVTLRNPEEEVELSTQSATAKVTSRADFAEIISVMSGLLAGLISTTAVLYDRPELKSFISSQDAWLVIPIFTGLFVTLLLYLALWLRSRARRKENIARLAALKTSTNPEVETRIAYN